MVFETLINIIVCTEAFVTLVVVMVNFTPRPSITLDAKMIVASGGQFASSCSRLKYTLSQRYTCRNMIFLHLFNSNVLV